MAGEVAAAPVVDSGGGESSETVDTGATTEAPATGAETQGAKPGETAAQAAERRKIKRFGKETELDVDTAFKMLDDDFEHEFPGPDGKAVKLNWRGIERAAQKDAGALAAMEKANNARKKLETIFEHVKADNFKQLPAFLEQHIGIEDFDAWALDRANQAYREHLELEQLHQQNPVEYHNRVQQIARNKFERRQALEQGMQRKQQEAQQQAQQAEHATGIRKQAFEAAGVEFSPYADAIGKEIWEQHAKAGMQLTYEQLAPMVAEKVNGSTYKRLDSMTDEQLLKWLGDKRRERLRAAELVAMKGAKAAAKQAAPAKEPEPAKRTPKNGTPDGMISDKDFRRTFGIGSGTS